MTRINDGKLLPDDVRNVEAVLDVGTGAGDWAVYDTKTAIPYE